MCCTCHSTKCPVRTLQVATTISDSLLQPLHRHTYQHQRCVRKQSSECSPDNARSSQSGFTCFDRRPAISSSTVSSRSSDEYHTSTDRVECDSAYTSASHAADSHATRSHQAPNEGALATHCCHAAPAAFVSVESSASSAILHTLSSQQLHTSHQEQSVSGYGSDQQFPPAVQASSPDQCPQLEAPCLTPSCAAPEAQSFCATAQWQGRYSSVSAGSLLADGYAVKKNCRWFVESSGRASSHASSAGTGGTWKVTSKAR